MKIIVCIKQVPDTNEVKLDPVTNTLIREGVPSIINYEDKNALEAAIRIKEARGGAVTVLCMGPPQADVALREALAMGADEAILVGDRAFAGSDTLATAFTLSEAIERVGGYDLIICGHQAIDGNTAQVGPQIAEHLGIPQVTYAIDIQLDETGQMVVQRKLEDGYEVVETRLPCVLTAIKELNEPRFLSIQGILDAYRVKEVKAWTADSMDIKERNKLGLEGSPTKVRNVFTPTPIGKGDILTGAPAELAEGLVKRLKTQQII
jgi:electron transfer flavoprotein beta subunit